MVNFAGCEWGRDCWGEMYHHRELSNKLNRNPWEKFKDGLADWWRGIVKYWKKKKKDEGGEKTEEKKSG